MTPLAACPSCSRHVRVDETRCPFCSADVAAAFAALPPPRSVVGRLSRAALFAVGASAAAAGTITACGDDDTSIVAIYGAPAPAFDAGAKDAADATDTGTNAALYGGPLVEDAGGNAALYGLPPSGDK